MKRMLKNLALAALVVLAGCSNIFAPTIKPRDPPAGANQGGTVRINIEGAQSSARTLLPAASGGFTKYDLLFEDRAGLLPDVNEYNYTPNAEVAIPEGTWTVTVSAYLSDGTGGDRLAATGQAEVTAAYGVAGEPAQVVLRPVDTTAGYTGNGTFAWDISFPALTGTASLTITRLDGTLVQTLSLKGPADHGTLSGDEDRSEGSINLPAGSYYLRTVLTRGGGTGKAQRRDALFILEGLTTIADAAAGYAFTSGSFGRVLYVTSAADSGPGSLRQAITEAAAGDTVQLTLPPRSGPIVLQTALAINTALTIEGNGVTLTHSGSSAGLLRVDNITGLEVALRRIHFKGGQTNVSGGAIYNSRGPLVLESCIFSGNHSSVGGAVAAGSDYLTVLGCTFYNNTADYGGAISAGGANVHLGGNLFYGNTAGSGNNVVRLMSGTTATSLGGNVSDHGGKTDASTGSGFAFADTDTQVSLNSVSKVSFRPFSTGGAPGKVNPSGIAGYPTTDFYGDPIPENNAAAGAVQIPGADTGYILQTTVRGSGTLIPSGASPGPDGLYTDGAEVSLTAEASPGWHLAYWTVNGVTQAGTSGTVTLSEDTEVLAVFGRKVEVKDEADLRSALNDQQDYDLIAFALTGNKTMTLSSPLPALTKMATIEGNGATLTAGTASLTAYLAINNSTARVVIRRLHFKGFPVAASGSALTLTAGTLTVESCVFSGIQRSGEGPAIYAYGSGTLTVLGCAFYGNKAVNRDGGAIYINGYTVQLAGNLFYGNTARYGNVVYRPSGSVVSLGYNVSDYATGTDYTTGSGFAFASGDAQITAATVSPVSFKPVQGSDALNKVDVDAFNSANPSLAYPKQDFYGDPISGTAAAGAVQGEGAGYFLHIVTSGSGEVTGLPAMDAYGFVAPGASFTLTANPTGAGSSFVSLTVNGAVQSGNSYGVINLDKNLEVLAKFGGTFEAANETEFRVALADPECSVISLPAGGRISLASRVTIARNLIIEGNGAVIAPGSGVTPGGSSQLLYVNGASTVVIIRRVHFANARTTANGGAIYNNNAALTLESCVFSDNETITDGGAVYTAGSSGSLTVLGSAFYNNRAQRIDRISNGGAIYVAGGTLQLAGNVFYGNRASSGTNVVYRAAGTVTSLGYNVSDLPDGESGFAFVSGDTAEGSATFSPVSFKPGLGSPLLNRVAVDTFNGANSITYPARDFYGAAISGTAAAGAVQTPGTGYALSILTSGRTVTPGTSADSEGFYAPGTNLTLTASVDGVLDRVDWTVNGVPDAEKGLTLQVTMNAGMGVRADIWRRLTINSEATLAAASASVQDYDVFWFDADAIPGKTIVLGSNLPVITGRRKLIIEGNGCALDDGDEVITEFFTITKSDVVIRRLHFKNEKGFNTRAALDLKLGMYVLESCIFSNNGRVDSDGGAIRANSSPSYLVCLGCTFYNNKAQYGGVLNGGNTVTRMAGNLFYRNTTISGGNIINSNPGVTASLGYNVSDLPGGAGSNLTTSGFDFVNGDKTVDALSFSTLSFKPGQGSPVLNTVDVAAYNTANVSMPYPTQDFYGSPIPATGTAAAGAVQTPGTGYSLGIATQGSAGTVVPDTSADSDGFYASGTSVILTASLAGGGIPDHVDWTVNGVKQTETGPSLTVSLLENKGIVAELWRRVTVDSEAALREALTAQQDGDVIWLDANNIPGKTITLSSALPNFTKKVIIEGNGIALAQGSAGFQGLYVMDNNAKVAVRGVHFKDWQAVAMSPGSFNNGGAIFQNAGKLALESCVFSGNKGGTSGTIYVSGGANTSLTVLGSAFVNNTGSEILVYYAGTLQLGGNLFYGNTSRYVQGVGVSGGSGIITITSLGYNVSDKPSGTGTTQSGFAFAAGDKTVNDAVAFSPVNFKPSLGSPLLNTVDIAAFNSANPERPYPQQDFYGDPIATTGTAAAGAVQEVGGYLLAVTTDGSGQVTGATPDAGGFIAPGVSFTLLAIPTGDNSLRSFSINGQEQNSHTYSVTSMNENLTVRAVFRKSVTVSNETEFLAALADPECDGVILLPADGVITLNARASIAKNFVIEGNGAVITRSSAFPSSSTTSQLIYIYGAGVTVRIRQVHFRDGQAQGGSAIYNRSSTITLESCVFSGNKETSDSWGGAVYIYGGGATILGCTFYANVGNYGGAVCINGGTLNLGGNLFYGNTARDDRVVFSNGTITSLGYNVSDKPGGTGTTQSGFVFAAGDKQLTNPTTDPLDPSDATHPYKPAAASLSDITIVDTSAIPGYPEKDFYGTSRSGTVPAGAVANY